MRSASLGNCRISSSRSPPVKSDGVNPGAIVVPIRANFPPGKSREPCHTPCGTVSCTCCPPNTSCPSTTGSLRPTAVELPYAMAKAGLNALTLALAGAWAPKVRANLVLPGAFDTDIAKAWPPAMKQAAADMNPLKRIGRPEDMIGACVFLASDAASYVNGAQVLVDGGLYRTL